MSNELVRQDETFSFSPRSLEEAEKYAMIIANSGVCPQALKGRPNDVLVILQMGHELKLKPMQALRSLGCINGMPFAYGDGLLALVKRHPEFENIKEWIEGDIKSGNATAYCTIMRKGQEPQTRSFSIEDAQRAQLWKRNAVWQQYPQRMLQHRARGYACKDVFPDALYGLMSEDEVMGINKAEAPKVAGKGVSGLRETLGVKPKEAEIIDAEVTVITEARQETDKTDETYVPERDDPIINEFLALIEAKKISESVKKRWCAKAGVTVIDDLPIETMQKIINHYQSKETN